MRTITDKRETSDNKTTDDLTINRKIEIIEIKITKITITKDIRQEEMIETDNNQQEMTTREIINKTIEKEITVNKSNQTQELKDFLKKNHLKTETTNNLRNKLLHPKETINLTSFFHKLMNKNLMKKKSSQVSTKDNPNRNLQDCPETPIKETKKEEDHQWISAKKR